ncbi:hypothetical protein [Metamycoplasma gateae]|uniref:Uncharacterized protein n=1 Tax=Metamycoplasma gateae TaxID=35769 RepID=A0ABZ2AIE9_9BACT|nr:hypothetical protein V2E26_02560 [Metamycoplasma gateae]
MKTTTNFKEKGANKSIILPKNAPFLEIIYNKLILRDYKTYEEFKKENFSLFKKGILQWMKENQINQNLFYDYFYVCFYSKFVAFKQEEFVAKILKNRYPFLNVFRASLIYDKFLHVDLIAKSEKIINENNLKNVFFIQVKSKKSNLKLKEKSKLIKISKNKAVPLLAYKNNKGIWVFEVLNEQDGENIVFLEDIIKF